MWLDVCDKKTTLTAPHNTDGRTDGIFLPHQPQPWNRRSSAGKLCLLTSRPSWMFCTLTLSSPPPCYRTPSGSASCPPANRIREHDEGFDPALQSPPFPPSARAFTKETQKRGRNGGLNLQSERHKGRQSRRPGAGSPETNPGLCRA